MYSKIDSMICFLHFKISNQNLSYNRKKGIVAQFNSKCLNFLFLMVHKNNYFFIVNDTLDSINYDIKIFIYHSHLSFSIFWLFLFTFPD